MYSPVSLATAYELELYQPAVRAHTSGSCFRSQRSLGPTACEDRALPPWAKIASAPNSSVSSSISAPARLSMPYRMAGRSGRSRGGAG